MNVGRFSALLLTVVLLSSITIARPPSVRCNVAESALCAILQVLNVIPAIRQAVYEEAVLSRGHNEQLLAGVLATLRTESKKSPLLFRDLFPGEDWPALENVIKLGIKPEDVLNFLIDESIQWLRFFFLGKAEHEERLIKELIVPSKRGNLSIQDLIDYNSRKLEKSERMKLIKFEPPRPINLSENIFIESEDSKKEEAVNVDIQKRKEWYQSDTPVVLAYKPVMAVSDNQIPLYRDVKRLHSSFVIDQLIQVKGEPYTLAALTVRRMDGREEYAVVTRALTYSSAFDTNPTWYLLNSAAVDYVVCSESLETIGSDYRFGILFYVKISSLPMEKRKDTLPSMSESANEWDQSFTEPIPRSILDFIERKKSSKYLQSYHSDSDVKRTFLSPRKGRDRKNRSRKKSHESVLSYPLSPRSEQESTTIIIIEKKDAVQEKRKEYRKDGRVRSSGNLFSYFRSSNSRESSPRTLEQGDSDQDSKEPKDANIKPRKTSLPAKHNIITSSLTKIDLSFLNRRNRKKSDDSSSEESSFEDFTSPRNKDTSPKSHIDAFFKRESPRSTPKIVRKDSPKQKKHSPKSNLSTKEPLLNITDGLPMRSRAKRDSISMSPSMPTFSVVNSKKE